MEIIENKILRLEDQHIELLSSEEEKNLHCTDKHTKEFRKINGKIYKVKKTNFPLDELIGEEVSKYFRLQTVDSIVAVGEYGNKYLLTELFTKPELEYSDINNFTDVDINLLAGLDNLDRLRHFKSSKQNKIITISKKSYIKLVKDIKKMIVRDFITTQRDRHVSNIMFEVEKNNVRLTPVFDYEYSFGHGARYINSYFGIFDMDLDREKVRNYVKNDKYLKFLLYKALKMDITYLIGLLENKGVIMSPYEMENYIDYVDFKKEEILERKVL